MYNWAYNVEVRVALCILAMSYPLQQRPYTFAQTNLWRLQISLAARRRTIHFACGEAADHTFRLRDVTWLADFLDDIWLVSFMDYDLGYFDLETRVLEPLENPFGPKVLPMS